MRTILAADISTVLIIFLLCCALVLFHYMHLARTKCAKNHRSLNTRNKRHNFTQHISYIYNAYGLLIHLYFQLKSYITETLLSIKQVQRKGIRIAWLLRRRRDVYMILIYCNIMQTAGILSENHLIQALS